MPRRFLSIVAVSAAILSATPADAQISFEQDQYLLGMGDSVMAGAPFYAGRFIFRQGEGASPTPSIAVGNIALRGARSWELRDHQVPQVLCARTALRPTVVAIIAGANDVFGFDFDFGAIATRVAEAVNLLLNNPFASAPVRDPATGMPCPALRNVTILVANYYSIPLVEGLPPQIPALLKAFNDALAFAISSVPVPAGSRLALVDLYTPSLDRDGLVLIERRGGFDGPLDFDPHPTNAGYTFIAKQFEDALSGLP
jgi:hypothetical protein